MPNWCTNFVMVQGDPNDVDELVNAVTNGKSAFSFNQLAKVPEALSSASSPERDEDRVKINLETYGAKDWYDWSIKNWGTKWDVDATIVFDETSPFIPGHRTVKFQFDSAWSPPLPVYDVLAARFPNTNIYVCWDETGCDFAGYRMYRNGELIKHHETESYAGRELYHMPTGEIFDYFPREKEVESIKQAEEERRLAQEQVETALKNMQNLINNL